VIIALSVCSALFLLVTMRRTLNGYDEGIVLVGALRVLAGDVIHRDFYANYGPAQFYVLSALFSLFSPMVLVERGWDIAIRAGTTILCYLLAACLANRSLATRVYLGTLIWLAALGFYGYTVFPALFFALLSIYLLLPLHEGRVTVAGTLSAGVAAGLVTLFRYDVGFAVGAAELLVGAVFLLLQLTGPPRDRRRRCARFVLLYAAGGAVPIVPVAIAYVMLGVSGDFWFDIVYFSTHYYTAMRSLPLPPIRLGSFSGIYEASVYLPVVTAIMAAFSLLGTNRRVGATARSELLAWRHDRSWAVLQLLAITVIFLLKGVVRVSPIQVAMAIIVSLVLVAAIAGPQLARRQNAGAIAAASLLVAGYFTAAPLVMALTEAAANLRWMLGPAEQSASAGASGSGYGSCHPPPGLERLACLEASPATLDAVRYVEAITRAGDFLFVGAGRHDKIFANDVSFYFLAKRRPATKWYQFDPGLQTSLTVQTEMVAELEDKKPPVIVLDSQFDSVMEPNASSQSSHVVVLDRFISTHYRSIKRFGGISILTRITD